MQNTNKGNNQQHPLQFDYASLLQKAEENEEEVERDPQNSKALHSHDITKKHYRKANKMEESFLNGVASVGKY